MEIPRSEYPRPDFERDLWVNLNGLWEFDFDDSNCGEIERWYENQKFIKNIVVPFCYQSKASGINEKQLHEVMWYRRLFTLPDKFTGKRILLNFGAVDYHAKVWINGEMVGEHEGGYVPFCFDVTRFLHENTNTIVLRVEDKFQCNQPRGKQYWKEKPDRCWYTATSGIWQTVWLEAVEDCYLERIKITPDVDARCAKLEVYLNKLVEDLDISLTVIYKSKIVNTLKASLKHKISKLTIDIKEEDNVDEVHYWTPEAPNLYDLEITLSCNGHVQDRVKSYFGMRKISVKGNQILLNNKPYYQKLVLDQGYWPDSLLTPPSDDAIKLDVIMTKQMGFNGARKHQKIEDPRYYYWADKLGLLVWSEMPSAYEYNDAAVENITREWFKIIERDYNHPCIIVWVPLNESWGVRNILYDKNQQNFAISLYYLTKSLDVTRLVSTNDGWEQVESDICGIHDYVASGEDFSKKYVDRDRILEQDAQGRLLYCNGFRYAGQPVLITEYGGIAFKSDNEENWGYFGAVQDEDSFFIRYESITRAIRSTNYIRGYCYTQLTDVMQEINGLMTSNRKMKVNIKRILNINS